MIKHLHFLLFEFWRWCKRGCNLCIRIISSIRSVCVNHMVAYTKEFERERRNSITKTTVYHNMSTDINETFYARQYWYWIEKMLKERLPARSHNFSILDIGCGQGRITSMLAKWVQENCDGKVIGVDISAPAIDYARKKNMFEQCKYIEMDILDFLLRAESASFYCVVSTEVFFVLPKYKDICREINRILCDSGLFICSVRSKYFNVLYTIEQRQWSALSVILNNTEGYPWDPAGWLSWHTTESISKILVQSGFKVLSCRGIGVCSGIEGDPLSKIVQPGLLVSEEQDELMKTEIALAGEMANCGRYIFIASEKL